MTTNFNRAPSPETITTFVQTVSDWAGRLTEHLSIREGRAIATLLEELGEPVAAQGLMLAIWTDADEDERDPWPWLVNTRRYADRPQQSRLDALVRFAPRHDEELVRALTAGADAADSHQQKDHR